MLYLNRSVGERIIIGDDIVIEVIEVRGGNARLGITAPAEIPIHRFEVWRALRQEQQRVDHQAGPGYPGRGRAGPHDRSAP